MVRVGSPMDGMEAPNAQPTVSTSSLVVFREAPSGYGVEKASPRVNQRAGYTTSVLYQLLALPKLITIADYHNSLLYIVDYPWLSFQTTSLNHSQPLGNSPIDRKSVV